MGHQVNFHATPADIGELESAIRDLEPMAILHRLSPTKEPRRLSSLRFSEDSQPLLFYHLVRIADLPEVLTQHVPAQGYWTIDLLRSPVVEFSSCYFDQKILRRGRVYCVDGFFGPNEAWIEKPESFRLWAKSVMKATRKTLRRHGTDYIGKDALTWLERENGKLEG